MALFVNDTFTDTNGTALSSHTGELGATWTALTGNALTPTIQGNALDPGTGSTANALWYASGTAPSADYSATAIVVAGGNTSQVAGPGVRLSTSAQTGYFGFLFGEGFAIYKYVSGTLTQIGSTIGSGLGGATTEYTVKIAATGTTIELTVQRNSDSQYLTSGGTFQVSETTCISQTDSAISGTGRAGLWLSTHNASVPKLNSISADDGAAPALSITTQPTNVSVTTPATATFTVAATGGTPSYTYQWQRSTDSGSNWSNVSTGSGGTTTSYTTAATTVSGGNANNGDQYRCVVTDSAGTPATVNSNAATLTVSAGGATTTYAPTNASLFFSPFNWRSDGAGGLQANNVKGSSTFAQTNTPGAYLKFKVTLAAAGTITLNLDNAHLSTVSAGDFPQLAIFRDSGAPTLVQLSGTSTQAVALGTSLAAGTYSFVVLFKAANVTAADRWNTPRLSIKVTGLTVPSSATLGPANLRSRNVVIFGDSITEGVHNRGTTTAVADQDAGYTWAQMLAAALDAEVGIVGFGGQGWNQAGAGSSAVPAFTSAWDLYSAGQSRLVSGSLSPAPDLVIVAHGENDAGNGTTQTVIGSTLTAIRAACTCRIAVIVPFTGDIRAQIEAATLPSNTVVIDSQKNGGDGSHFVYYTGFQNPLHPDIQGSAFLAPRLAKLIERDGLKAARTVTLTLTTDGTTPAASLSSLKWAWWDRATPDLVGAPTDQGTTETTNGSGVLTIPVRSVLSPGGIGWLVVTDSDGTTSQSPAHKAFCGPAAVA